MLFSLRSVNYPTRYLRHRCFRAELTERHSELDHADSVFRLHSPFGGAASLESVNYPGYFLTARPDGSVWIDRVAASDPRAQFRMRRGVHASVGVTLESVALPSHFLRHRDFAFFVGRADGSELFLQDATFHYEPAAGAGAGAGAVAAAQPLLPAAAAPAAALAVALPPPAMFAVEPPPALPPAPGAGLYPVLPPPAAIAAAAAPADGAVEGVRLLQVPQHGGPSRDVLLFTDDEEGGAGVAAWPCAGASAVACSHFRVVAALNGEGAAAVAAAGAGSAAAALGLPPSLSLESVARPGFFLQHAGFRLFVQRNDGSALFSADASWRPLLPAVPSPALAAAGAFRLQSANYPDRAVRSVGGRLLLELSGGGGSDGLFQLAPGAPAAELASSLASAAAERRAALPDVEDFGPAAFAGLQHAFVRRRAAASGAASCAAGAAPAASVSENDKAAGNVKVPAHAAAAAAATGAAAGAGAASPPSARRLVVVFNDMRYVRGSGDGDGGHGAAGAAGGPGAGPRFQLFRTACAAFPGDDILFLRDDAPCLWFLGAADALAAALARFAEERAYSHVCAFGSSSGGFAVLAFAARLRAFRAGVALLPQGCLWSLQRDRRTYGDCCSLLAPPLAGLYPARFDLLAPLQAPQLQALPRGCVLWSYNDASPTDAHLAAHVAVCGAECGPGPGGRRAACATAGCPPAVRLAPFTAPGQGHAPSIGWRATPDWFRDVVRPHFDAYCDAADRAAAVTCGGAGACTLP